jgi:transcriptional regulator with XRE-family HTH domain
MMTGAQIRAARGFLDWSVRDLGKKAKVHFNTVHAIERGKSVAKPETLAAIRKALEKAGVQFTDDQGCGLLNRAGSSAGGVVKLPFIALSCHYVGRGGLETCCPWSV